MGTQSSNQTNKQQGQSSVLDVVKGLVVLAVIVAMGVMAFAAVVNLAGPTLVAFFASLSSLDSAIVVALITATVSIVTVIAGGIANNVMKRNEYLRQHREEPYMRLISLYYDFNVQSKLNKEITQEEIINTMNSVTKELTLWGSSKAIRAWGKWRVASSKSVKDPNDLLFGMEKVLIQFRKDMGLKRGIKQGDLLRLTVNDIDDYVGRGQKGRQP